jgi:hypothetical protein
MGIGILIAIVEFASRAMSNPHFHPTDHRTAGA